MRTYRALVHTNGPSLSPAIKPLREILKLKATTPGSIFSALYQGVAVPEGGYVFRASWYANGRGRFFIDELGTPSLPVLTRVLSFDTAEETAEDSAFTACVVGDLLADYRLAVSFAWQEKLDFPDLPAQIEALTEMNNQDGRVSAVVIEAKSTGKSAYKTLYRTSPAMRPLLRTFTPTDSKVARAQRASVWMKNGSVLMPYPSNSITWLAALESQMLDFPKGQFADLVDALTQLIAYLEAYLTRGHDMRIANERRA